MNVIVDPNRSRQAATVERKITAAVESKSITRVLFKRVDTIDAPASGQNLGHISWNGLYGDTDWNNYQAEYLTFRVSGIRFEVYDTEPSVSSFAVFGTYDIAGSTSATPEASLTTILDSPDSGIIPPGQGMRTFYWYPEGPRELGFYDTSSTSNDYGGLRYIASPVAGSGTNGKWRVITTYIVDFRSRT